MASSIYSAQHEIESASDFIARMTPKYAPLPRHLRKIVDVFEATRHREVAATISMPPRGGKTETVTHCLAWRTIYDPACLNFYAAFGDGLAQQSSRKVRKLVREAGMPLAPDAQSVHQWHTILGGGLKATSVGGEVTGRGCNSGVMVADDIVKGREWAESKLNRDRAWDWFRDDYMSRLEPGASMVVNMTRWHEDDVIGRLKQDPLGLDWIHVEIPAVYGLDGLATDERDDPNAQPYWPEAGYDLARLASVRARGEHGWWSLFQQRPFPRGGVMFDRSWFHVVERGGTGGRVVRGWDLAASTERDSAATAGVKIRLVDGKVLIEDIVWKQGTPHEVEQLIVATAQQDGAEVEQSLPQDPGQAGKAQRAYLTSKLHGYRVHFSTETGSKELRAEPLAAQAQAGNVMLVRADWNAAALAELESFPVGRMKDRVDAASRAYARLIAMPTPARVSAPPIILNRAG